MFASLSDKADVSISGSSELVSGQKTLYFEDIDATFEEIISHRVPFRVIITPTAENNGMYIADKINVLDNNSEPKFLGFQVKELNSGSSSATFDWMVIARRAGYETAEEIADSMAQNNNSGGTEVLGCTDDTATNYNADATTDDGSCEYAQEEILGCMDSVATNYNADATTDDGSCEYAQAEVLGCMDNIATNYNPDATIDDGSCEYAQVEVLGCMDDTAINYNVDATTDDGSCTYA